MRIGIPAVVATVLVGVFGLFWLGFGRDPSNVPDPLVGHPAPLFSLKSTSGQEVSLASLRGRPVVINFFADWCTACRAEESNLVRVYRRWHRKVTFLGIVYEDSPQAAASFTHAYGGTWADLVDPHAGTAINYGISGLPTTFFVNSKGMVTGYTISLLTSNLAQGIHGALASS